VGHVPLECPIGLELVFENPFVGDTSDPVSDPTNYHSFTGALQYLTFTRLDISYRVQQVYLHMHDPREPHMTGLKRILCYL
jgi:hypothetical protein